MRVHFRLLEGEDEDSGEEHCEGVFLQGDSTTRVVAPDPGGSHCRIRCTAGGSCGGSAVVDELDAVAEPDSLEDLGEGAEAAPPALAKPLYP